MDCSAIAQWLGYLCVSDRVLHDDELKTLETFMKENNLSEETKERVKQILDDSEEKMPIEELFSQMKEAGEETLQTAMEQGLKIAYSDGFFDRAEEFQFEHFLSHTGFDRNKYSDLKVPYHLRFSPESLKNGITLKQNGREFSARFNTRGFFAPIFEHPEYEKAVLDSYEVAKSDLEFVESLSINTLERLQKKLSSLEIPVESLDKSVSEFKDNEVIETLRNESKRTIQENILKASEQFKLLINQKKRTLDKFTISLLGKTKAGKSTLHAILTGEGDEFIGCGMQRTTRFNRIYDLSNIRIIDTPGIGAPDGQSDEEIAKSVIDESDLICYILTNDSAQETELNFLHLIKDHNKPVLILLNVKENIETHLERFLKDPLKWFTRTDNNSLQGHLDRINRYADEHFKNGFFEIIPVQLLAAKMAQEENYHQYSDALRAASRIDAFLEYILKMIQNEASIKKSQTIIDGSIYICEHLKNDFEKKMSDMAAVRDKINEFGTGLREKIKKSYDEARRSTENKLTQLLNELKYTHAKNFAKKHYADKEDELPEKWETFYNTLNIQKKIDEIIEEETNDFNEIIQTHFKQVEINFHAFLNINGNNLKFDLPGTFNTKGLVRALTPLTGFLVFTGPIGWAVAIGSVIGSILLPSLFDSKEEKLRQREEMIYQEISTSIENQKGSILNTVISKTLGEEYNKLNWKILDCFSEIILQLDKAMNNFKAETILLGQDIDKLNEEFAGHIIRLCSNGSNYSKDCIKEVTREYGNCMSIILKPGITMNGYPDLSKILQEEILFINGDNNE